MVRLLDSWMPLSIALPRLAGSLVGVLALACSPTGAANDEGQPLNCSPGQTTACSCPNGATGTRPCSGGACSCSPGAGAAGGAGGVGGRGGIGGGVGSGGSGAGANSVPCAVQNVLGPNCSTCHGRPTNFAAPMSLVTFDDLHATARDGRKVYEVVSERIQGENKRMPPPPNPKLSQAGIDTLKNWVAQGAPSGEACQGGTGGTSGASGMGGTGAAGGMGGTGATGGGSGAGGGPADCANYYELRAHGGTGETDTTPFAVPKGGDLGNQYMCFYFKPPYEPEAQALWFDSLFDHSDTRYLHHWLLYGIDAAHHPSGTSGPCSAAEPGAYLLAGWAPGAVPSTMPPGVGLQMPTGPNAGLILEVHYYNPQQQDVTDRTGVKFCTVPKGTRPNTAAVHFTGSEGICIEPNSRKEVVGPCIPRADMRQDIHIVNVWPHMHKYGRRMKIEILRVNGTVETLHDEPFDFNSQIAYPKDVVLKPGDLMQTRCYYENMSADRVHFGERTQDEMCFGFVTAWPAGALQNDPLRLDQILGGGLQPTRRCLDPLGILQSCNGLGDYPQP
jgi:hypothetical protein